MSVTFSSSKKQAVYLTLLLSTFILGSCAHYSLDESKASYLSLPQVATNDSPATQDTDEQLFKRFAPVIKIFDAEDDVNKVGTPKALSDKKVYVDSSEPSIYTLKQSFQIEDRSYTNLIYRVHFSGIPFSIIPFHLSYGKNVGLIFVVTLNEAGEPVLFTTTHTCGCYMAMMATSFTPETAYPDSWKNLDKKQKVYGERLPTVLKLDEKNPDICVAIRPHEHRIMDAFSCNKSTQIFEQAQEFPIASLRTLKTENGETSFFHESGLQEGFVKGAIKPWESMSLSFLSLDPFVGTDKAFLRKETSDNTFYTSLKPWNRKTTDMADFPSFLKFWGWKL